MYKTNKKYLPYTATPDLFILNKHLMCLPALATCLFKSLSLLVAHIRDKPSND